PADGLEIGGEELNSVFQPRNPRKAPGPVRNQAEELNEVFGVKRGGVLIRHGIGESRAEEIYQKAGSKDHDRTHSERGKPLHGPV
ncbi:MAG: hypothetical protein QOH35_5455, partial [Acidobacteriaceae bacterium]|nr:hypothetical protein [Acidobacteriaceae bacterium]